MQKIFRYHNFSGKQKGSFTKLFVSVLWDKKIRQNRDAPAHICIRSFELKKFLKQKIVLQWSFLAQWDKNFSKGNRDNSPLSSIKTFPLPKNLWNAKWSPGEVFSVLWDERNFPNILEASPLLLENFRFQNSFETQKCSPRQFIGTMGQKFFNGI